MADLSDEARSICARWFNMTPGSSLRSHPPHAVLSKVSAGMDELVAAGIVTRREFNQFGVVEFFGSERAVEIGRARLAEVAKEQGW